MVNPLNQRVNVLWTSPTGVAPKQIELGFSFEYNGIPFTIPSIASTEAIRPAGHQGAYTIDANGLAQIAREYVDQLNGIGDFGVGKPLPVLSTKGITVRPISGDGVLDAKSVTMSNALTVIPKPAPFAPAPAQGASQLNDNVPPPPVEPTRAPETARPAPADSLPLPQVPAPSAPGARLAPARPGVNVARTLPSRGGSQGNTQVRPLIAPR